MYKIKLHTSERDKAKTLLERHDIWEVSQGDDEDFFLIKIII